MRIVRPFAIAVSLAMAWIALTARVQGADSIRLVDVSPSDVHSVPQGPNGPDGRYFFPCTMCPCDYIVMEGLMMQRDNAAANNPLVLTTGTQVPSTVFSTGDLNFDLASGFRIYGGHRFNECWAIEAGYFGLWGPTATASVIEANQLLIPGDLGLAVNNFGFADRVDLEYTSQIQGAEANAVLCTTCGDCCDRYCQSIEWIGGVRYLSLTERFSLTSYDSLESVSTYQTHTQNNLYGGQAGARIHRCYGRFSLEGTGKAGAYYNYANQAQDAITDFPSFLIRDHRSASDEKIAFVGELSLTGIYQLNCVWGLRAGYNLMWVEGVALAPDQLDFTNTQTSGTAINLDGSLFVHGLSAGLEARW